MTDNEVDDGEGNSGKRAEEEDRGTLDELVDGDKRPCDEEGVSGVCSLADAADEALDPNKENFLVRSGRGAAR